MPSYNYKDNVRLQWEANNKRIRTEFEITKQAALNEALAQHDLKFNAALQEGQVLELEGSRDQVRQLVLEATQRQLGGGDNV